MQATLFSSWCREAKISFWNQQQVWRVTSLLSVSYCARRIMTKLHFRTKSTEGTITIITIKQQDFAFLFLPYVLPKTHTQNPALFNTCHCKKNISRSKTVYLSCSWLVHVWGQRDIIFGLCGQTEEQTNYPQFQGRAATEASSLHIIFLHMLHEHKLFHR